MICLGEDNLSVLRSHLCVSSFPYPIFCIIVLGLSKVNENFDLLVTAGPVTSSWMPHFVMQVCGMEVRYRTSTGTEVTEGQ